MPANAFLTNVAIGNREDLIDIIYNTAPTETPLISSIEKVQATAVRHDWQRDTLRAAVNNVTAEGADATYAAIVPTQRLDNQCQIARETFSISDTQEAVRKAGRKSEINYQKLKKGREVRRDMELGLIENPVFVTGVSRQARGLRGWLATNNSLGVSGVAPNVVTNVAPTDGTLRNFTEALLRSQILAQFNSGGNGKLLMVAPSMKQTISSTFTGGATKFTTAEDKKVQGAVDIYVGDFGDLKVVPNRQMVRTREAYLIDPDMVALAVLSGRDMATEEIARIGSARNYMIETEYTLEMREERAHACVRDIQAV